MSTRAATVGALLGCALIGVSVLTGGSLAATALAILCLGFAAWSMMKHRRHRDKIPVPFWDQMRTDVQLLMGNVRTTRAPSGNGGAVPSSARVAAALQS